MNIGFDLDRIFINYPPLVPARLIDWLYRDPSKKELSYRIPTFKVEQYFRKITHFKPLRPKIQKNIDYVNILSQQPNLKLFLVSSRFQFLEKLTHKLLQRLKLDIPFTTIFLNVKNEQPHLFKEQMIKKLKLNIYIDDDLELLLYLKNKCPGTKLLWYHPQGNHHALDRIRKIKDLQDVEKYLKKC